MARPCRTRLLANSLVSQKCFFLSAGLGYNEFHQICRAQHHLSNRECHQKLFSGQPVMFISLTSQPPFEKLCELIQLCGGTVCKTLRQAGICIGKCKVGRHADIRCLSEKWILDSIIQNEICPLESYILQNKD